MSTQPGGVAVQGSSSSVRLFAERVGAIARTTDIRQLRNLAGTVASSIDQLTTTDEEGSVYFELSPRAIEVLRSRGAIPAEGGLFRSLLASGSELAGAIDWKRIEPGPQLLQLQTAAVGLALQASIEELAAAVERVEDKVDHLTDRVRSVQVGEIFAHHRLIAEHIDALDAGQRISDTDWSSIDHLRAEIARNVDATRVLLRAPISRGEPGWSASSRAAAAQRLLDEDFVETLGLLAVCEHNLASWHRLRIDRVEHREPEHLERTLNLVESDLALHRAEDQELADDLGSFIDRLAEPNGLEGLELWKRRQLATNSKTLREHVERFTEERVLDVDASDRPELPTLKESLVEAKDRGIVVADRVWRSVRTRAARSERSDTPELETDTDGD
ncbi:MAG: hypothetical protein QNM02_05960 [Acidimicrobiia bacterium]|nr:hypothetical protein [Acidimicrobiia bacterium]